MILKIRKQLTLFCTMIISVIIITITFSYLYISETNTRANDRKNFDNTNENLLASISAGYAAYHARSSPLSYADIVALENTGGYYIHINNNGRSYLYESVQSDREYRQILYDAAEQAAQQLYSFYWGDVHLYSTFVSSHDFILSIEGLDYRVYIAQLPTYNGYMGFILLDPLSDLEEKIMEQRILFMSICLSALIAIAVFSYQFTGRVIKPLAENQKRQSQFIASASHELRTPLSVILSSVNALDTASSKDSGQFRNAIHTESHRMARLIDDLLLYASTENHTLQLNMKPVQPDTLLINIYEKYQPLLFSQDITFQIELPDRTVPLCLCDFYRMEQVFSIIINNALAYAGAGKYLGLSLVQKGHYLEFKVIDRGPGISDENKELVFHHFHRIDSSHASRDHFGLGLGIAKELITMQHGKIWVEDTMPHGCTFIIQLKIL